MRKLAVAAIFCVAAGSIALAAAPPKSAKTPGQKAKTVKGHVKATRASNSPQTVGTVTYDTGTNAGFAPVSNGTNIGNRFNSNLGGPLLMTGSVSMLTFFPAGSAGYVTVFGPPTGGGAAPNLGSFQVLSLTPNTFNVAAIGPVNVGPDFLAGLWENGSAVRVGMDNMSVGAQGFHAFQLNTNFPGSGTGFTPNPTQNAMVRSTGNLVVPVELMNFSIH
jgi:hypothetical protein